MNTETTPTFDPLYPTGRCPGCGAEYRHNVMLTTLCRECLTREANRLANVVSEWVDADAARQDCEAEEHHDKISIYCNDVWAGNGRLVDGSIVDCPAVLGDDQDESDDVYDAIEQAISDGLDKVTSGGDEYTWSIE